MGRTVLVSFHLTPQIKESRFMFGERYLLVENLDARGRRAEQWVAENSSTENLQLEGPSLLELADGCNTDKDKYTRKTKIARVNVVSYPCGIILSIEELFGSESLSQVLLPIYALMNIPVIRQDVKGQTTNMKILTDQRLSAILERPISCC